MWTWAAITYRDVEFSAAFDVDGDKVGKDVSQAIFAGQNNTFKFCDVPTLGVTVQRGVTLDGLGKYLRQVITESDEKPVEIARVLRDTQTDVVVNYLPVGSEEATRFYVEQILEAGCAMVNCIPVFIAREPGWRHRFERLGLPIIGDDIKSQVGATITHRILARLFEDRGVRIDRTYQLNFGGNTDFMNMLERERLESKKISKTNAVTSQLGPADAAEEHSRRTERLRAMARGSQVVSHPHGRNHVRRRPFEYGSEAGSVGQPEQCGCRD